MNMVDPLSFRLKLCMRRIMMRQVNSVFVFHFQSFRVEDINVLGEL